MKTLSLRAFAPLLFLLGTARALAPVHRVHLSAKATPLSKWYPIAMGTLCVNLGMPLVALSEDDYEYGAVAAPPW